MFRTLGVGVVASTCCIAMQSHSLAQSQYQLPPQDVVEILNAAPEPSVAFSRDGKWMLLLHRDAMPEIEDLARPMLGLAGHRIDPATNGPFQTEFYRGLSLRDRQTGRVTRVPLPDGCRIGLARWSHTSLALAFTMMVGDGTQLWWLSVQEPTRPIPLTYRLSSVLADWDWMPDGHRILGCLVPPERPDPPPKPLAPTGPNVQESRGKASPVRTFQDLLATPHDEDLFEYYATSQLVILDPKGDPKPIGKPGMIDSAVPSPDGRHILITILEHPFSFLLTSSSFPRTIVVWNLQGEKVYTVATLPLAERIPIEGVRTGPRAVTWQSGHPSRLLWTECLDGGDPKVKVPHREQIKSIEAPFESSPRELLRVEHRFAGWTFFADTDRLMTTETDRDRRWVRSLLHNLRDSSQPPTVLVDRSLRDRYGDPGSPVTVPDRSGFPVVDQQGDWIWLAGAGASPQGNFPFLDRKNLQTLETERLWQCALGTLESVVRVESSGDSHRKPRLLTRHETPNTPTNYYVVDLENQQRTALTEFEDPTPQIRGIKKEIVRYQRYDGVGLSATLYLPADHRPGTRLPLLLWAYPLEFNDADTAAQVSASPNQFVRMTGISHLTLVTQGYAVLDNATMPVIGDPETMNDSFVEQIVGAAKAAIDHAVQLGVADPDRVAVGGHSYGAFMTANLLAHCNLFKAGIARSGAYNRTLTPFGFQSERRPLWEAKHVYANISPFQFADRIKTPILLIHGENDNNPGTFPIQSQRMYQAIQGNGGTARLVMLPHESHGYRARQSVLHTQAEMIGWLNRYLRDADTSIPAIRPTDERR